jgi:Clp amino terminal domain, pathogenicity island component/Fic/DOC family
VITLDVADLVVIAGQTLGLDTCAALDGLDMAAAETALAEAWGAAGSLRRGGDDPAVAAAALLSALIRCQPFPDGNQQVAFMATMQFLAVNGWRADLDPPEAVQAVMAGLGAGTLAAADVATWLSPQLFPVPRREPRTRERPMPRLLPGRGGRPVFQRYTDRARRMVVLAQEEAGALNHNYVGTEHILLGLIHEGAGVAACALESLGISLEDVRQQVEQIIGQGKQPPSGRIPFTPRAKKVLELSLREAIRLGCNYIGTEHILLALIHEGEGVAAQVLVRLGADLNRVRQQVIQLLAGQQTTPRARVPLSGLGDYDEKIAAARQQKDAALDAGELGRAATLRGEEKRLLDERAARLAQWSAGVDAAALAVEIDRLDQEVARLRDLLARNGIEPGEGHQQTA